MTQTQSPLIHPTAVIDNTAFVHPTATVGAYCVVGAYCEVGAGTVLHHHSILVERTILGANNVVHSYAMLGNDPQDFKFKGESTWLRIGDANTFREYATVHRATGEGLATEVGNHNYFMAYTHVGHNCSVASHNILANAVQLAGHIQLGSHTVIGGAAVFHQGVRIGDYCMISGFSGVRKSVPHYALIMGSEDGKIAGLNVVGLRRNGFDAETRTLIKRAYKTLFYAKGLLSERLNDVKASREYQHPSIQKLVEFVEQCGNRGVCGVTRSTKISTVTENEKET